MFELADSLVSAVRQGSTAALLRGYLRMQDTLPQHRWSPLLSNHDGARVMTMLGGSLAKAKLAATLLLTLPGLPFVYYGEEIGMTGDKPDERIRTPMQWKPGPGTGFTNGTPWEAAQPDSMTRTVETQDADASSLLNLYRRLIHLRSSNDALAAGRLLALEASNPAVGAYLRREEEHAVLVVANLGATPLTGVTIASAPGALEPGKYAPRNLLGGPDGTVLEVGLDGSIKGYLLVSAALPPLQGFVLELVRQR